MSSLVKRYSAEQEAFWKRLTFPHDDWPRLTSASWKGEFRWFRSHNVIPFEWYRRPTPLETDQQAA
jgi:hypothetical protein